jgi:anti-anti-sigma regulatory factor
LKKKGGKLVIKGISKNLAEMFRLIKIDQVIPIEED